MQKISDVMHGVITIDEHEFLRDAAIKMIKNHRGSVIITNHENNHVGILTERDMLRIVAEGYDPKITLIREHYTKNIISADENTSLDEASRIMEKNRFRRLPVTKNGKIVGIVGVRSLSKHLRFGMAERFFSESFHPAIYTEMEGRNYR
jgi:CBS domain-containing protein